MINKRALICGVTGQDGSYLAELLIEKGYEVHGLVRRASTFNRIRIEKYFDRDNYPIGGLEQSFFLHYADLGDSSSIFHALQKIMPDEIWVTDKHALEISKKNFKGSVIKLIKNYFFLDLKEKYKKIKVTKNKDNKKTKDTK